MTTDTITPRPATAPSSLARLEHLATALGTARMVLIGLMDLDRMSDAELAAELYDPRGN